MKRSGVEAGAVGERVLALRNERGWSQLKLAKKLGVARTTIEKLESGQTATPSAETLLHLAEALGVDPWVILYGRVREGADDAVTPMAELFRLFAALPPLYQDLLLRLAREMRMDPPSTRRKKASTAAGKPSNKSVI